VAHGSVVTLTSFFWQRKCCRMCAVELLAQDCTILCLAAVASTSLFYLTWCRAWMALHISGQRPCSTHCFAFC
jgi:hypothetical protein